MSFIIDEDGTMYIYQGDSAEITVYGLIEGKDYSVSFGIQNYERKPIGEELSVNSGGSGTVSLLLTPELTELLTVPKNKLYEIYYYGIKVCEKNTSRSDTLFISDSVYGDLNRMIVYPRKVTGEINAK